mmetsp:Transcript_87018/g.254642  ORF Transcript_87018/g.254642 Transcript_87018/m.254642 type:complete len:372 (-) Transcript_87018:145-1260(-)
MGGVLSTPVTIKESGNGDAASKGLTWGHSCMQGWRVQMEDAHFALPSLEGEGWAETAAFAVMDGHGGKEVALFCEQHLPREIARGSSADAPGALINAFERIDEILLADDGAASLAALSGNGVLVQLGLETPTVSPDLVGCTCVVCLVRSDVIIVANAGDSRAVLSRQGQAVPLSEDHKPNLPGETDRIRRAGGTILRQQVGSIVQFRVNGNLNLSRSIGDLQYKRNPELLPRDQMICSTPEVQTFPREAGDEFLILACDGIWDVLGSQEAVDFVRERLPERLHSGLPLSGIMEEMLDHCLSPDLSLTNGLGGDNMTAMLIVFDQASLAGGIACSEPMVISESPMPITTPATVEERGILPTGLCGCKPDLPK